MAHTIPEAETNHCGNAALTDFHCCNQKAFTQVSTGKTVLTLG